MHQQWQRTYPVEGGPAIVHGSGEPVLRREPIVYVKDYQVTIESIHEAFAKVMISRKISKDPATPMKVDVNGSLLGPSLFIMGRRGLKDTNPDLSVFNRARLLGYAENIRTRSTTVRRQVLGRVFAKDFNRYLMRMQPSRIVFVVVLYVYRVKAWEKVWRDAVVERLDYESWTQFMQVLVSRHWSFL